MDPAIPPAATLFEMIEDKLQQSKAQMVSFAAESQQSVAAQERTMAAMTIQIQQLMTV